MSWGTCYSGSNNIYRDFPPIMNDGRNYTNWQPGASLNEHIKKEAGLKSNWEYRQYLCKNADAIIRYNQEASCDNSCGNMSTYGDGKPVSNNTPYLFKSTLDKTTGYGYEDSDLKNLYLSDVSLQSRMVTPVISQSELLYKGIPRAN